MLGYITIAIIIIILLLFLIKVWYLNEYNKIKFDNGIYIGNSQMKGDRDYQNDHFASFIQENAVLSVVADSNSVRKNGKLASIIVVDTILLLFKNKFLSMNIKDFFNECVNLSKKNILNNVTHKVQTTAIAVILMNNRLYWLSAGNCALFVYNNKTKEIKKINKYLDDGFEINDISINPFDKIMLCTNGVYNTLNDMEILFILSKDTHPQKKASDLMEKIKRKNYKDQDNCTIIVIENNKK